MTLPKIQDSTAEAVFERVKAEATGLLGQAQRWRVMINSPVTIEDIMAAHRVLYTVGPYLNSVKNTPGLTAYARTALNNSTYDMVADITDVVNKMVAVTNWIEANAPKDAAGTGVVTQRLVPNTVATRVTASAASLAPLAPLLDSLIASIGP
jgi:hypothetical protein